MTTKEIIKKEDDNNILSLLQTPAMKKQFAAALPKILTPDRFIRIALTSVRKNPKLLLCTKESFFSALLDLAQLGLEPDGRKAHLIPFMNNKKGVMEVQLIIDYKGLADVARRGNDGIVDIHADIVYSNDFFEYSYGTERKLNHRPVLAERGDPIAAYSFVRFKNGETSFEVMNFDQIKGIQARSKARESGPWVTDWDEMAKKTVFRRHSKLLPMSAEYHEIIEKDYDVPIDIKAEIAGKPEVAMPEAIVDQSAPEVEPPPPNTPPANGKYKTMLESFAKAKEALGDEDYYKIMGFYGWEHANQIRSIDEGEKVLTTMRAQLKAKKEHGK